MDPHTDKSPGLGLPPPSIEQGGSVFGFRHSPEASHVMVGEMPPVAPTPVPAGSMPPIPLQAVPASVPSVTDQQIPLTVPAHADDSSDDLDEEWVNKAKAIVERTKNDPFIESRELGKVKADYLKIRYNKQIKVVEDQSQ